MKGGLLAILGKPSKGEPEDDKDDASDEEGGDMSSSFKSEAMAAAKEGDLEGLATALMGYAKACKGE